MGERVTSLEVRYSPRTMGLIQKIGTGIGGIGARLRRRTAPTQWAGAPGFLNWGGYVDTGERDQQLESHEERYRTYGSILANTSIVAASVRYFLNLISSVAWSFEPSEADRDGKYAELIEEFLTKDMRTPWHRTVRRAAMYRFLGFSVQEWRMKRRDDGWLTFDDLRARPQHTIHRWDTDPESGDVLGMIQLRPQDSRELYIPRGKVLYLVDDALTDAPTGFGIFRHLVAPVERLRRYEQLEGWGFELDLRNVPIGRVPYTELAQAVQANKLTQKQADGMVNVIEQFVKNHVKNPQLGLTIESQPHESRDLAARPAATRKFDLELLSGSQTSLSDAGAAIDRINHELARMLGTEGLLLGSSSAGSFALSRDKTGQFYLLIEGSLTEVREGVSSDLIDTVFTLNGWPDEMKPEARTEAVRAEDIGEITSALRDLAIAGAPINEYDPVIKNVRDKLNLEHPLEPDELMKLIEQYGLGSNEDPKRNPDDPDEVPEDDNSNED